MKGNDTFEAQFYRLNGETFDVKTEQDVQHVLSHIQGNEFVVTSVTKKERKRNPVAPFITSSLQQEAARKLNFRTKKTMMVAQQLYEGIDLGSEGTVGLITYMRTDSTRVSESAQQEAMQYIEQTFGTSYVATEKRKEKQKANAQDAHEAIRPTSVWRHPSAIKPYVTRDQYQLYKLIWERFIASQMAPAVLDTVAVELSNGTVIFRATGSTVKFPGFMKVYVEGTDDPKDEQQRLLPDFVEGERVFSKDIEGKQHFTQPPPRYTEARLVKTLEELGIGRPSTYAPTLDTIQKRNYVTLENKRFVPTELGEIVLDLMMQFFPEILDVEFTAKMEKNLDDIEEGKVEWVRIIDEFYREFEKRLKIAEVEMEKVEIADESADVDCEVCGSPMVYKMGRFGKFIACSNFPHCRNTKAIVKDIGVKCPRCHEGNIVERKSKKKRMFYGCDRFPTCDFVSWDKPISRPCPKCGGMLVEKKGKKSVHIQCTQCEYNEQQ